MATKDVAPQTTWSVVGVSPTVDVTQGGQPRQGSRVSFVTGLGHNGEVFVPANVPVPDGAKDIIRAAATRTDMLATLSE